MSANLNPYETTNWNDGRAPAINAENLNKIEQGIDDVTDEAIALSEEIAAARGNYQNLSERLANTAAPTDEQVNEAVEDYLDEHPALESTAYKKSEISAQSQEGDSDTNYPTVGAVRDYVTYIKEDLEDYIEEAIGGIENGSY